MEQQDTSQKKDAGHLVKPYLGTLQQDCIDALQMALPAAAERFREIDRALLESVHAYGRVV